jgi:hypothetical protein
LLFEAPKKHLFERRIWSCGKAAAVGRVLARHRSARLLQEFRRKQKLAFAHQS